MRSATVTALVLAALTVLSGCNGSSATSGQSPGTPLPTASSGASTPAPSAQPSAQPSAELMPVGPKCVPFETGKRCLPVAPSARRVDLTRPVFSNPTNITHPLHPSSTAAQVIYGGQVDGKPFRTEFTRLPDVKVITWEGQQIRTVTWQYMAFSDGRIIEVALDWFAQADDGSVWYLGEDVFNYENGLVADRHGTWLAGKHGPPAMIMPAMPKPGAVYRPENAPGIVFEEVTVKSVGQSRPGPSGPISGVMVVNELHQDGTREDKAFAPGYGEFSTGNPAGDLEAVTLGIPVDARPGGVPRSLMSVTRAARATYDAIAAGRWHDARAAHQMLAKAFRSTGTLLDRQMARDISTLGQAIDKPRSARQAALRVAQNELDLRLRYLPLPTIERARFDLWTRQIAVDAKARDLSAVRGDVATLEWTWHRIKPTLTPSQAARIDQQLKTLRTAASRHDLPTTTHTAARVRAMV